MRFPKALNLWGYAVLQVGLISSMYFLVDYYEKMNLFSWFISLSKLFVAMCYHRGLVASFSICSRLNSPIFANNHTSIIGHFNKAFIAIFIITCYCDPGKFQVYIYTVFKHYYCEFLTYYICRAAVAVNDRFWFLY